MIVRIEVNLLIDGEEHKLSAGYDVRDRDSEAMVNWISSEIKGLIKAGIEKRKLKEESERLCVKECTIGVEVAND